MDQQSLQVYSGESYLNPDPSKRDYEWFNLSITCLRRDLRPIVNVNNAFYYKTLLDSKQGLADVIRSFDDKDFKRDVLARATPLGIMNVFVNAMIEDIKKAPPRAEVKANDPASIIAKKEDIELLKNRKILERDRTAIQQRVFGSNSQYKIPAEKFNSNVDEFDKMGLNEQDPDDVSFFEGTYQKLDYEIAGQQLVNAVMKLSKFDSINVEKYVRDAMSSQVICGQSYVNRVTGEIRNDYIYPEEYNFIPSDQEDGRDDIAKGWLRSISVSEFLGRVGNDFDWNRDWPYLIWAINYCNNTKYTGFVKSGWSYDCIGNPDLQTRCGVQDGWATNCCEWVMAFRYKVYVGYTEWLCPEVTANYLKQKGSEDRTAVKFPYPFKNKKERQGYEEESWYQWQLYGSYYLATTSTSQYLFNYGKVYHYLLEGANDEYARYTCWSFRMPGKSIAEIAEPMVTLANFTFYRMLWVIYKAKPEEDQYLINELLEVAKGVQRQFNQDATNATMPKLDSILDQIIQYQRQKTIRIRAYPRIDGREIGQLPPLKNEKSGLDPIAISMQAIVVWAQQMIAQQIGFNPMRVGGAPPPRESYKTEQAQLDGSLSVTGYVYRMIQYMKEHMATVSMLYAQDICKFKDSVPYKWITNMIGEEQVKSIKALDGIAAHRFAIFVEDMNDAVDKQEIKTAATVALQEKQITFDQWFVVTQTKDFKRGAQLMSFLQRKMEKKLRAQAIQDQQIQMQRDQQLHAMKMEEIQATGNFELQKAQITSRGVVAAAQISKEGKISVKELTVEGEIPKQQAKAQADIDLEKNKADLKQQESLATA